MFVYFCLEKIQGLANEQSNIITKKTIQQYEIYSNKITRPQELKNVFYTLLELDNIDYLGISIFANSKND